MLDNLKKLLGSVLYKNGNGELASASASEIISWAQAMRSDTHATMQTMRKLPEMIRGMLIELTEIRRLLDKCTLMDGDDTGTAAPVDLDLFKVSREAVLAEAPVALDAAEGSRQPHARWRRPGEAPVSAAKPRDPGITNAEQQAINDASLAERSPTTEEIVGIQEVMAGGGFPYYGDANEAVGKLLSALSDEQMETVALREMYASRGQRLEKREGQLKELLLSCDRRDAEIEGQRKTIRRLLDDFEVTSNKLNAAQYGKEEAEKRAVVAEDQHTRISAELRACLDELKKVQNELSTALIEHDRANALVSKLTNDLATLNNPYGSLGKTSPVTKDLAASRRSSKANLGLATTDELHKELAARARVGGYADYRTVDEN